MQHSPEAPAPSNLVQPLETLVIEDFGVFVGKHSERLRVSLKGEVKVEAPLLYLRQVIVKGRGVSLSTDLLLACAERGIAVHVVGYQAGASLYTDGLTGTVQTRRSQLLAYDDTRGVELAIAIAQAKLRNQAGLLRYHARSRKQTAPDTSQELKVIAAEVDDHQAELDDLAGRGASAISDLRPALLSIEGRAAQRYWKGVKCLVPGELNWEGRRHRGARDAFNSALNYGYAILARQVEQAIVLAGLDPFAGFVHVDRPGKPSLTLDLIEEFRQAVVDRVVLGMVNRSVALPMTDTGMLQDEARKALAHAVIGRIEESAEPYEGKRRTLREIIQSQARHIATVLRGQRPQHQGFVAKW